MSFVAGFIVGALITYIFMRIGVKQYKKKKDRELQIAVQMTEEITKNVEELEEKVNRAWEMFENAKRCPGGRENRASSNE